jgi:hypothetical protein
MRYDRPMVDLPQPDTPITTMTMLVPDFRADYLVPDTEPVHIKEVA